MTQPGNSTSRESAASSDEDLIRGVEKGDDAAVEELYRRHLPAGLSFARRLVGNDFDADDAASEAFLKVIGAIQRGNGPDGPFRPYLLRAVRTCVADHWTAQSRVVLFEDPMDTPVDDPGFDHVLNGTDRDLASVAFASLPARWQTVLWHLDVEREPPRRVAPLLGLEPNAVSAVAARARKGLRQAYLEAYVASSVEESCKPFLPLLAKSVTDGLSPAEDLRLQKHLEECPDCRAAVLAMADAKSTMRRAVGPWFLGLAAAPLTFTPAVPAVVVAQQVATHSSGLALGPWAASVAAAACVVTGAAVGLNTSTVDPIAPGVAAAPARVAPMGPETPVNPSTPLASAPVFDRTQAPAPSGVPVIPPKTNAAKEVLLPASVQLTAAPSTDPAAIPPPPPTAAPVKTPPTNPPASAPAPAPSTPAPPTVKPTPTTPPAPSPPPPPTATPAPTPPPAPGRDCWLLCLEIRL